MRLLLHRQHAPLVDPEPYHPLNIQAKLENACDKAWEALKILQTRDGGSSHSLAANNLRCVALALQNRATREWTLPIHISNSTDDQPRRSWRVEVLPYLDEEQLWRQWNRQQAWDDPANSPLSSHVIPAFNRWDESPFTRCIAVTGAETCWPDDYGMRIEDITDDWSQTILVIEYPFEDIHWAEPRDLTLEQALELYSQPSVPDVDYIAASGRPAVRTFVAAIMADGRAVRLPLGMRRETLRELFTATGGEIIPAGALEMR